MVPKKNIHEKSVIHHTMPGHSRRGSDWKWYLKNQVGIPLLDYEDQKFMSYSMPCKKINGLLVEHVAEGMATNIWKCRLILSRVPCLEGM